MYRVELSCLLFSLNQVDIEQETFLLTFLFYNDQKGVIGFKKTMGSYKICQHAFDIFQTHAPMSGNYHCIYR